MKTSKKGLFVLFAIFILVSCGSEKQMEPKDIFTDVVSYLEKNGDFINSDKFPAVINVFRLQQILDSNTLVLDVRKPDDFNRGHIPNSIQLDYENLIDYFETEIESNSFKYIVIVCYSGESASYGTELLRLLGYNNVYALRFGSSAFSKDCADGKWLKNCSTKYEENLEIKQNRINTKGRFPKLLSNLSIYDYLREKSKELLKTPFSKHKITADEVFAHPEKYYIISYLPQEVYDKSHLPGAFNYVPKQSLHSSKLLNTLPNDKTILVYCNHGHQSAFIVAYLHILGFQAKSLAYGTNSFMHKQMMELGKAFTTEEIIDMKLEVTNPNSSESKENNSTEKKKAGQGGC